MKRHALLAVSALLLVSVAGASKVPMSAWQSGILKDSQESWHSRTVGMINNTNGMLVGREYPIIRYTIESPTYIYEADLVLKHKRDKQPSVTVNGPIKFAIVKSDFYILDEQGKEIKLTLAKKTLKQSN
ncbi:MAG TPA: hypothetical protein VGS27_31255 [Candidatus Sulfotelmatobacter sp.]|nr:hypothetical protein [Candidatus Sulfotelmatobacter sp.]HEV2468439.1 hypothetical protein [Candidatus Sulfotelmatobacter sp.]